MLSYNGGILTTYIQMIEQCPGAMFWNIVRTLYLFVCQQCTMCIDHPLFLRRALHPEMNFT